jgi:hypothetical protein
MITRWHTFDRRRFPRIPSREGGILRPEIAIGSSIPISLVAERIRDTVIFYVKAARVRPIISARNRNFANVWDVARATSHSQVFELELEKKLAYRNAEIV